MDSFRELAQEKPIDKISIREITENCGYSPATFYRQFKDKYDLIAWEYAQGIEAIMFRAGGDDYAWKQTLIDGAMSYQKNKEYLSNLLRHTAGHDSFIRYMAEINFGVLVRYLLRTSGEARLDRMTEMYVRIYVLGTVNLTCEWILGKYALEPEELAEVFEQSLPIPLRAMLLK